MIHDAKLSIGLAIDLDYATAIMCLGFMLNKYQARLNINNDGFNVDVRSVGNLTILRDDRVDFII